MIGAGVAGLSTALQLKAVCPSAQVIICAQYIPGDSHITYTSPWAGANWLSAASDNGRQEEWDAVTYRRFSALAANVKEAGVEKMPIRAVFDNSIEESGVLSQGTGKVWYEKLVGGLKVLEKSEVPEGASWAMELDTFVINVQSYLPW